VASQPGLAQASEGIILERSSAKPLTLVPK
jgi:hypothetical protein